MRAINYIGALSHGSVDGATRQLIDFVCKGFSFEQAFSEMKESGFYLTRSQYEAVCTLRQEQADLDIGHRQIERELGESCATLTRGECKLEEGGMKIVPLSEPDTRTLQIQNNYTISIFENPTEIEHKVEGAFELLYTVSGRFVLVHYYQPEDFDSLE